MIGDMLKCRNEQTIIDQGPHQRPVPWRTLRREAHAALLDMASNPQLVAEVEMRAVLGCKGSNACGTVCTGSWGRSGHLGNNPPILPSKCYSVKIIIYLGLFTMLDHSTARVSHSHGPAAIPQGKARALYHRCCPSTVHVLTFAVPPRPHF